MGRIKSICVRIFFQVLLLVNCGKCEFVSQFIQYSSSNLTEAINEALEQGPDANKRLFEIQGALKRSPFVYYETDIMLNEMDQLLPVIALLELVKPTQYTQPKLVLAFRYLNQTSGKFQWSRLGEILNDAELNISQSNQRQIADHVAAIVLDFYTEIAWDSLNTGRTPGPLYSVSFATFVKEFVKLQFGEMFTPQVGLRCGSKSLYNIHFKKELVNADFVIFETSVNSVNDFPNSFNSGFVSTMIEKIRQVKTLYQQENVTLLVKIAQGKSPDYAWSAHGLPNSKSWSALQGAVNTTQHFDIISKNLVKSAEQLAGKVFENRVSKWAESQNGSVVVWNSKENQSEDILNEKGQRDNTTIPYVAMRGDAFQNNCELISNLNEWKFKYETIIVDEVAWAAIKRNKRNLDKFPSRCATNQNATSVSTLNVMTWLTDGFREIWSDVAENVEKLLHKSSNSAGVAMNTIIFSDADINESVQIQNFLKSSKDKGYNIGCALDINKIPSAFSNETTPNANTFKNVLESNLCQPMFQSIDLFVWSMDDDNYFSKSALISGYTDVILTREIFLQEFPEKRVIIQFTSLTDTIALSKVYNVPMAISHSII